MDIILNRRSVREFDLNKKISYDELVDLCRYAEAAPSARNQRSREYIIIDDENIINELSNVSKGSQILKNCNTAIVVVGKDSIDLATPDMQEADLAAATENILLAATQKGFGSCWIGVSPIIERMASSKEILNIKGNKYVYSMIALGYPMNNDVFFDKNKFRLEDVFHNKE